VSVLDKRSRDDPRRQATEQAFLEATKSLLDDGASFADLNVSRIAERAGRTRTAFYTHFSDRRELLLTLLRAAGGDATAALAPFLAGEGPITRNEVTEATQALLENFQKHASLVRAVIEAASYDEQIGTQWSTIVRRIIDDAALRLQTAGLSSEVAAPIATALVWMTERTCYQQAIRNDTDLDDEQLILAISDVWWNTIRAAAEARRPKDGR
jgi:AcrR family transcriptional regulator